MPEPEKPEEFTERRLNNTADKLRFELIRIQIEGLKIQLVDMETRLRVTEKSITKFDFLLYLTMGGGLVGLFNLALLAFTLINNSLRP